MAISTTNAKRVAAGVSHSIFDVGPKAVPAILTNEISVTCRYRRIRVTNPNGGSLTSITIQDGAGNVIDFAELGSGGILLLTADEPGELVTGGISWVASAPGLTGYILADPYTPA